MERERVRERTDEPPIFTMPVYTPDLSDAMRMIDELHKVNEELRREGRMARRETRRLTERVARLESQMERVTKTFDSFFNTK